MPNYGTYAICPYFNTEDPISIKCEGIIKLTQGEALYHIKFPDKKCKKHFMRQYCESHCWCNCPYAALLESSYDDTGSIRHTIKRKIIISKSREYEGQLTLKL
jgi:hypothetical protein